MGTVAEEWMERGKAEDLADGKAEAVLRILRDRFGEVDARLAAQVRAADAEALDTMLDRALMADHPDEVFGNTSRH